MSNKFDPLPDQQRMFAMLRTRFGIEAYFLEKCGYWLDLTCMPLGIMKFSRATKAIENYEPS